MEGYHIAAQLCAGHGGEVGCACVVFAATDDAYTTELACAILLALLRGYVRRIVPLWKLSSMGGTMLYTFLIRSFLATDAIVK